jgi:DNA-binding FrmR family transcriptional regulator
MLDYQRIVDDVRSALINNGQDGDDFLHGAAADYSLAIDEVNERLRQCGAFLRKGLRSEAIQLCEVEPNLLDVVGILDFPERDTWNELLALHSLSSPSALLVDVAANLNEAYAIEQPLATLLQRHRLLALSHAPIRLRVETLRSLADADPENAIWDQDVRTFEEERVKELQREVPQAIARHDTAALSALAAELEHSAWRIDSPVALIQQIAVARSNAARQKGLAELREAADGLNTKHAEFDVDGGRRAREQWGILFSAWGRHADPSLVQAVAAPLEWLREQDEIAERAARQEAAIADLDHAITTRRPAADLHRLHREAKREGDLPASLEARYVERLESIDRAARRRMQLSLAVFAGFILIVGGIIGTVVYMNIQAAKADRAVVNAVGKLQQLVQDNKLDEARNFIDQLSAESPSIAEDARIQEISSAVAKQVKDEDDRRRDLAAAMELLRKSISDPDKEALARAKKLAKTDEEKAAIRLAEEDIATQREKTQSKVDQDFLAQLKPLKGQVDAIEKEVKDKPHDCDDKLNHLAAEISKLEGSNPQISEAARKPAELLRTRVKSLVVKVQSGIDELSGEESLTAAVGDSAAFRQKLLDYAQKFPQARCSGSFRAVAGDESPLWDWVGQWNETIEAIGRRNSSRCNRKAAADLASKLRKLLDERDGHPDAQAFRQRLPYLESIAHRIDGEGNPIEGALKPVFSDPLLAGVWMLKDAAGQRFYLLEDPAAKFGPLSDLKPDRTYGFQYVTGFNLTKKGKSLRGSQIMGDQAVAPQRATATALMGILEATTDESWEPSFCRMIDTVLNDKESDPLLKRFLLRKIVTIGCEGSLCLQNGFGGHVDLLKKSAIPSAVNWVDPDDSVAAEQRPLAGAELGTLPSFADAQASAGKEWKSLGAAIGTELTCVGWLSKNGAGNWRCLTKSPCPEQGKLVIVRPVAAAGQKQKAAVFEAIGRLDHGKAVINAVPGPSLAEGRPVYTTIPHR